MLLEKRMF